MTDTKPAFETITELAQDIIKKNEAIASDAKIKKLADEATKLLDYVFSFEKNFSDMLPMLKAEGVKYSAIKHSTGVEVIRFEKEGKSCNMPYTLKWKDSKAEDGAAWSVYDDNPGNLPMEDVAIQIYRKLLEPLMHTMSKPSPPQPYDMLTLYFSNEQRISVRSNDHLVESIKKKLFGGWIITYRDGEISNYSRNIKYSFQRNVQPSETKA